VPSNSNDDGEPPAPAWWTPALPRSPYFNAKSQICEPDGTVIGHRFCVEAVRYTRADGLEEGAAQIARSALLAVAEATNKILDALELAAEPLSRGHIMFIGGKPSARFGHRWSELSCRCCTSASG